MADADTVASINGTSTVLLNVRRQSGTNTVEVANDIKERIEEIKQALPPGYDLRIVRDTSEFIEASITNVEEHLIVGIDSGRARRAAVPREPALDAHRRHRDSDVDHRHVRPDLVHGLHARTRITMLALTLSVGIVIDDAIVVLENIYRFIEEKGDDAVPGGDRRHARRSASPCWRPRCRWSRFSCRSPSWAASSAGS